MIATRTENGSRGLFILTCFLSLQIVSFFTGPVPGYRPVFGAAQIASFGLLFLLYRRDELSLKEIIVIALLLRVLFALWLPGLSDDAYRYIWDGMVQHLGLSPFELIPQEESLAQLHTNPVYEALNSKRYFAVYPPLSQGLFYLSTLSESSNSFGGWIESYYVIKLVRAVAEMLAMLLVVNLLKPRLALLYALNPLVIVECAGQGHAEAGMVFGLSIMLLGFRREWKLAALGGLFIAVWTKLYPILFLPILLRKIGYRYAIPFVLLSLGLLSLYYTPETYSNISKSVDLYVRSFEFNAGIYYALKKIVNWWTGVEGWGPTIGPVLRALFFFGYTVVLVQNYRRKIGLLASAVWIASLYLMTATTVHPWYLMSLMLFLPFIRPIRWEWYVLAGISVGCYLRYSHSIYWPFVIIAWIAWAMVWMLRSHKKISEQI